MQHPRKVRKVMIATDGSTGAQLAVEEGVWLAKMLGAEVLLAAVARPPLPVLGDPYYQHALTAELGKARASIAAAIPFAEERAVPFDVEVLEGRPAATILELARSRNVDLIVVGSRGRGALTGAVLGSVSAEVVHHADRPVLVVRPANRAARVEQLRRAV